MLKKILTITFSNKAFVNQLQTNSESIADINRLFRDRATTLNLVSFYESRGIRALGVFSNKTLLSKIIVPESAATLRYPKEISSPLNGNHIEIAKYASESDGNYDRVSKRIVSQVQKIREERLTTPNW